MSLIRLRYVQRFHDRHGKIRYYFRRPGFLRAPLPGLPGSTEFMAAYQAALRGELAPAKEIGADRVRPGSMSALIVSYYQSVEYRSLKPLTHRTYRNILERLRFEHGDKPVSQLQGKHVRDMMDKRVATPGAANNLLKMLRILMRFAVERDWRRDDRTLGIRKLRVTSDGFRAWSDDDIEAFEAHWPPGTRAYLALALLLYTAQRRSDVVGMGRQHLDGDTILVRQQKTNTRLAIPLHPTLEAALDTVPPGQLTFLTTHEGKAFSAAGFTNWFVECARAAGLPARSTPHGLRKAAARRLAEAGCTAHQIMTITGHKSLSDVTAYTAAFDQRRLARSAMKAVERRRASKVRTVAVKPVRQV